MIVYVELLTPALAEITVVPRWWRRWFRRERETTRFAVRHRFGGWTWDHSGRSVASVVAAAIRMAEAR